MCHFLLGWQFVIWDVRIHVFVHVVEVAVDGSRDASAVVDLFWVVEEGLWCDGAW